MTVDAREQTLARLRLVASLPGVWELRAFQGAKRSEEESLVHYGITKLKALSVSLADQLVRRLMGLARERPR